MHDSLITKNFVVFPYLPLFFDGQKCAEGKSPYQFDNGCNAYYGVLPKSADSAGTNNENIRWFKIPGAHQVFHFVNAWEETDADGNAVIVAYGCAFHQNFNLDLGLELGGSKKGKDQEQEAAGAGASKTREDDKPPKGKPTPFVPQLTKFVFHLDKEEGEESVSMEILPLYFSETGLARSSPFPATTKEEQTAALGEIIKPGLMGVEFPRINERFTGKKNRYFYGATTFPAADRAAGATEEQVNSPATKARRAKKPAAGFDFEGFVKYDLEEQTAVAFYKLPDWPNQRCGEMYFEPKFRGGKGAEVVQDGEQLLQAEDDGYVMGFVHSLDGKENEFMIWDVSAEFIAKNPDSYKEPITRIKIPVRIPSGFHSLFIDSLKLQEHKAYVTKNLLQPQGEGQGGVPEEQGNTPKKLKSMISYEKNVSL